MLRDVQQAGIWYIPNESHQKYRAAGQTEINQEAMSESYRALTPLAFSLPSNLTEWLDAEWLDERKS